VYAVKKTRRKVTGSSGDMRQALREVHGLAALGTHAHILRYYRAWIEDGFLFIQTEYCG
jgi:serine/threonine protein kinase